MKVSITKESRKVLTIEDAPKARKIIADLKENDSMSVKEYAEMAVNLIAYHCCKYEYCKEIFKATAEITKNPRIWNIYDDNSGTLDVWLDITAETSGGFLIIGAYLSDIWRIGPTDQAKEIASHMYIRKFEETK